MLVLSRKRNEKIVIGDEITLMVIEIKGDAVRLGIEAPRDVGVHRQEVYDAIQRENAADETKNSGQVARAVQNAAKATRPFHKRH